MICDTYINRVLGPVVYKIHDLYYLIFCCLILQEKDEKEESSTSESKSGDHHDHDKGLIAIHY